MSRILLSHIQERSLRRAWFCSVLAHALLLAFFALAGRLYSRQEVVLLSSGAGGGRGGDFVRVGLSPDSGGGAGMYKPALTSRPEAPPPLPEKASTPTAAALEEKNVFLEKSPQKKQRVEKPSPGGLIRSRDEPKRPREASDTRVPGKATPGAGGLPGVSGTGGGFGGGQGVAIGPGTGEGLMESWYARQVEQRIGANWLKTSLGVLDRPVQTVVSFEIEPDGSLVNIRVQEESGLRSVDLAAERAVRASNPLPPLPRQFRNRRVRFLAYFQYPIP